MWRRTIRQGTSKSSAGSVHPAPDDGTAAKSARSVHVHAAVAPTVVHRRYIRIVHLLPVRVLAVAAFVLTGSHRAPTGLHRTCSNAPVVRLIGWQCASIGSDQCPVASAAAIMDGFPAGLWSYTSLVDLSDKFISRGLRSPRVTSASWQESVATSTNPLTSRQS